MKHLLIFLLTLLLFGCNPNKQVNKKHTLFREQTIIYGGEKFALFNLKYATDTTSIDGIDWNKEKLTSEFTLKGKSSLRYSITIKNDSVAQLSRYNGKEFVFQDNISISEWTISRVENNRIISELKITDFDKDGDEDLICWINTNVNGNIWTVIYLNIPEEHKLRKLYSADGTDVWDAPMYDNKTKIITCELVSGVYGFQSTYTHKLINHKAIPLKREDRDYTTINPQTDEGGIIETYIGENAKWKLVNTTTE